MKGIIKFFCLSLLLHLSSVMMTYAQSINFKDYFPPKGYHSGMTVLNATGAGCQFMSGRLIQFYNNGRARVTTSY